jgi:hypothetical protein
MNAIPQERRRQFLDELAKITGRALPPEEPIRERLLVLPLEQRQVAGRELALAEGVRYLPASSRSRPAMRRVRWT